MSDKKNLTDNGVELSDPTFPASWRVPSRKLSDPQTGGRRALLIFLGIMSLFLATNSDWNRIGIGGSQLWAATQNSDTPGENKPAPVERPLEANLRPVTLTDPVEPPPEANLRRVMLTEKAAKRLGIQTAPVRDEQIVRKRIVGGEAVALPVAKTKITAPVAGTLLAPLDARFPVPGTHLSAGQTVLRLSTNNMSKGIISQLQRALKTQGFDPGPIDGSVGRQTMGAVQQYQLKEGLERGGLTLATLRSLGIVASNEDQPFVNLKVSRDSVLLRLHIAPGQVVESGQALFEVADLSKVWVRVLLNESDLKKVDRGQPALVLPPAGDHAAQGLTAQAVEMSAVGDLEQASAALYYVVDSAEHGLVPGQRVRVELPLSSVGPRRKVIPYAAVLYGPRGDTWTYTNLETLVFVRHPISIDYIEGDLAVLSHGPPSGTAVVTVGATGLLGTELGLGH